MKTVSAYANYATGRILFGVTDSGEITGLSDPAESALQIEQRINDALDPVPEFQLEIDRMTETVELTVFRGTDTPYLCQGQAYRRVHTSTRPVTRLEFSGLSLAGIHIAFDELPSSEESLTFRKLQTSLENHVGIRIFGEDILRSLGLLLPTGAYTNAAALLADTNAFPGIRWMRFGENGNEIYERGDLRHLSLLDQTDRMMHTFSQYYPYERIESSPERILSSLIPSEAFREAVANALVHRSWDNDTDIFIGMYKNRIEIVSQGGLPPSLTEEEYLNAQLSVLRNPTLAGVFTNLAEKAPVLRRRRRWAGDESAAAG